MMINLFVFTGRVASSVKFKYRENGEAFARFVMAVPRVSNKEMVPDFLTISAFGKLAEACNNNLIKGRRINVQGSVHQNTYVDKKTNETKYFLNFNASFVEFADNRPVDLPNYSSTDAAALSAVTYDMNTTDLEDLTDDDLPW